MSVYRTIGPLVFDYEIIYSAATAYCELSLLYKASGGGGGA